MNDEILFPEQPEMFRRQMLADNCDETENITFTLDFSDEEMAEMRKELGELDIHIDEMDEARKAYIQQIKDELKPIKQRKKELIGDIRRGFQEVSENCFKFICREEGVIKYYRANGHLIKTRPIGAKDQQRTIIEELRDKTGTFD